MKKLFIDLVLVAVMLFAAVVPGYAAGPSNKWSQVGGLWVDPSTFKDATDAFFSNGAFSFVTHNGTLYAGTNDGVRYWNGSSWIQVGNTVNMCGPISLFSKNGLLYAGASNEVWVWDDSNWSQLGTGDQIGDSISCLLDANGILYAGTYSSGVWAWDGSNWSQLGGSAGLPRTTYAVQSLLAVNNIVYAGTQGGVWAWDGSNWSQVGDSVDDGAAPYLFTVDGKVHAGGDGLWAWDGSNWSQVDNLNRSATPDDSGPDGQMLIAMDGNTAVFNGKLYAVSANGVWSWNGSEWSQIGDAPNDNSNWNCLIVNNDTLYVGTTVYGVWGMKIPF